ncbi:MAG: sulfatase family protein [Opitutales bacterium]
MRTLLALSLLLFTAKSFAKQTPNIVYIYADDQGWGEAQAYNPDLPIATPGIDRIASEGMRFADAHSASSVCTPSRYALLTGRYAWRTRLQKAVVQTGQAPLIAENILTVPQLLKQHGYDTAIIGKWHLSFSYKNGKVTKQKGEYNVGAATIGAQVIGGPITRGFDVYEGFHHAREMLTWIEQDVVTENFESAVEMLPRLTERSVAYIDGRREKSQTPFFLYVPLNSPHSPVLPAPEWKGKSGINDHADFVMQTDDAVKQILDALDRNHFTENTLVIFSTDNGTAPKPESLRKLGYDPLPGLKGNKMTIYEGGHRVPFVARWPGVITPGSICNDTIVQVSLMATVADMLEVSLPDDAGVDSFSILPLLQGKEAKAAPTHPLAIHHSFKGKFAIRKGNWKFIADSEEKKGKKHTPAPAQLYNLAKDRGETNNLYETHPEKAQELLSLLEKSVADGRTRPGPPMQNDVEVDIWKLRTPKKK